jgi:hypothetical protein
LPAEAISRWRPPERKVIDLGKAIDGPPAEPKKTGWFD